MHADRDDAPFQARRKSSDAFKWLTALAFGSGVTAAAILIASVSMGTNNPAAIAPQLNAAKSQPQGSINTYTRDEKKSLRNWWKADEQQWEESTRASQAAARERQAQEVEVVWTQDMLEPQAAPAIQPRQTSFHDGNYTPQGAVNVVPATRTYSEPTTRQQPRKQQEIVVVGREQRLKDFCPYAEGSVERRNCRMQVDLNSRNR